MREIKFRGKRKGNKEWVYGGLFYCDDTALIVESLRNYEGEITLEEYYEVDPETVGQYIGIKDDNDKEIYESDIICIREFNSLDWEVYQVKYHGHRDYPAFDTEPTIDCDCNGISYATACCNIEKIGNIFDNPELLEVEQ